MRESNFPARPRGLLSPSHCYSFFAGFWANLASWISLHAFCQASRSRLKFLLDDVLAEGPEVFDRQCRFISREDKCALKRMLQLSYVTFPFSALQQFQSGRG